MRPGSSSTPLTRQSYSSTPGDVHVFADASLPTYDRAATELMTDRVLALLSALE